MPVYGIETDLISNCAPSLPLHTHIFLGVGVCSPPPPLRPQSRNYFVRDMGKRGWRNAGNYLGALARKREKNGVLWTGAWLRRGKKWFCHQHRPTLNIFKWFFFRGSAWVNLVKNLNFINLKFYCKQLWQTVVRSSRSRSGFTYQAIVLIFFHFIFLLFPGEMRSNQNANKTSQGRRAIITFFLSWPLFCCFFLGGKKE